MEFDSESSSATFSLTNEDHTLANSLRFTLNQDTRVVSCGYSIPHPSDAIVNIRVQTTGDPAVVVLQDACNELILTCNHVVSVFEKAVVDFKIAKAKAEAEAKAREAEAREAEAEEAEA